MKQEATEVPHTRHRLNPRPSGRGARQITAVYSPTAAEENTIMQSLGRTYSILVEMRETTPSNLVPGIPLGPQP